MTFSYPNGLATYFSLIPRLMHGSLGTRLLSTYTVLHVALDSQYCEREEGLTKMETDTLCYYK